MRIVVHSVLLNLDGFYELPVLFVTSNHLVFLTLRPHPFHQTVLVCIYLFPARSYSLGFDIVSHGHLFRLEDHVLYFLSLFFLLFLLSSILHNHDHGNLLDNGSGLFHSVHTQQK